MPEIQLINSETTKVDESKEINKKVNKDLDTLKVDIKSNNEVKNELIAKYLSEYKNLQVDVINFLNKAFSNSLPNELWDFNIDKFNNKDNLDGFSKYELDLYAQILDKAMSNMNILWWYEEFKDKYTEIWEEPDFLSWKWDIALANKLDLQEYIFWEWEKYLTDNIHNYSNEELHIMREEKFDITDSNKMKNFIILLWLELWDWVQDILKFLWNIPSWLILLPRYITNRTNLIDDKINTIGKVESQMDNDALLRENPSLMLWELLWEKGIQMIKQLWEMFVSWKNGDIALVLVTIAWLLAWWAGIVKLWAKWAKMTKTANVAGKIQNKAGKVDDIVWWAWIWHITGAFNPKVEANAGITNENVRVEKWAELLWDKKLTKEQKNAIIVAHKVWEKREWAGVYNYTQAEILEKSRWLKKAWFNKNEIRILMENGIVWKIIDKEFNLNTTTVSLDQLNKLDLPNIDKLHSNILKLNKSWVYIWKEWAKRLEQLNFNVDDYIDFIKLLRKKWLSWYIFEIHDIENFVLNPQYRELLVKSNNLSFDLIRKSNEIFKNNEKYNRLLKVDFLSKEASELLKKFIVNSNNVEVKKLLDYLENQPKQWNYLWKIVLYNAYDKTKTLSIEESAKMILESTIYLTNNAKW